MNPAKIDALDYIDFLIASPRIYSCTEAARVHPARTDAPAHDAFTRLLQRLEPDPETLWTEAAAHVQPNRGILVLDDSTLDKPYAHHMELVALHWSGKQHRLVQGINLVTLLWSDGARHIPCDYRLYAKATDGATKNDHFRALLTTAHKAEVIETREIPEGTMLLVRTAEAAPESILTIVASPLG